MSEPTTAGERHWYDRAMEAEAKRDEAMQTIATQAALIDVTVEALEHAGWKTLAEIIRGRKPAIEKKPAFAPPQDRYWPARKENYDPEEDGYQHAKDAGFIVAAFCEDCAAMWCAHWTNMNIARPEIAQRWREGFMRSWREMRATFKKEWPYV